MYDLGLDFRKFYYNKVVLPKDETTNLREKKKLNIERLTKGIEEYNIENKTNYKIAETLEQGSVAMSTVTQNENNDYDIDVAIVFDETNLNGLGPIAVKNMVVDSLKRKCTSFKTEPKALTNCVRIVYTDNYHIDFAIYKRIKQNDGSYKYEHAGSEWRGRDPRAINKWFRGEIKTHGEKLRQAVRLSKMFCKSRDTWQMPGGLIQSVLCDEKIQSYDRIDEMFYYTMIEVKNRLEAKIEVCNPTDDTQSLLLKEPDKTKVTNFCNRLEKKLGDLDILFDDECTQKEAIEAWYEFFKHCFWTYDDANDKRAFALAESVITKSYNAALCEYDDNEEYIGNIMPVEQKYYIKLDCKVIDKNNTIVKLSTINNKGQLVPLNRNLEFYLDENRVPKPYEIYWKVKNQGIEAIKNKSIRGEIFKGEDEQQEVMKEYSSFAGNHFVECYIVKNGVCVAKDKIIVPIGKY